MELDDLLSRKASQGRPLIICLCGSTRYADSFREINLRETLAGNIILSIGCDTKSDHDLALVGVSLDKEKLDTLHLWKIDMADMVMVLNVDHYIGESTRREIQYAVLQGKTIRWLLSPTENETSILHTRNSPDKMPTLEEPSSVLITTKRAGWAATYGELLEFVAGMGEDTEQELLAREYAVLFIRNRDVPAGHPTGYFPLQSCRLSVARRSGVVTLDVMGEAGFEWLSPQPVALFEQAVAIIKEDMSDEYHPLTREPVEDTGEVLFSPVECCE